MNTYMHTIEMDKSCGSCCSLLITSSTLVDSEDCDSLLLTGLAFFTGPWWDSVLENKFRCTLLRHVEIPLSHQLLTRLGLEPYSHLNQGHHSPTSIILTLASSQSHLYVVSPIIKYTKSHIHIQ